MGLLPDTYNCGLCMRRECRERFPRHRLQKKSIVSDPGMHHGTCVTHVSWCMSGSLTRGSGENVPGIPDACVNCNFMYLVRGPCQFVPWNMNTDLSWLYICYEFPHWEPREVLWCQLVVTGGTGGCRYDNLWCCQWWQRWRQFSMFMWSSYVHPYYLGLLHSRYVNHPGTCITVTS